MYGKHFASMYSGSMVGAGLSVFAVWGYVIANTVKGCIEINPKLLAMVLGCAEKEVIGAIEYLCKPDPDSRSGEMDGCRLVKEGQFQYIVPTHEKYRHIANEDERRDYNRIKQKESRERRATLSRNIVNTRQQLSAMSAHTEAEAEAEAKEKKKQPCSSGDERCAGFDAFWQAYPRKTGKKAASKAWKNAKDKPPLPNILSAIASQTKSDQWTKDGGQFVPNPATWLNQGRWADELAKTKPRDFLAEERASKAAYDAKVKEKANG